jgi:GntR family transcriptional regulator, arabinose operon transcriptional repressor
MLHLLCWEGDMGAKYVHNRLAEQLESRIRRGEYQPGQRLPSEHRLARELGVSRGTLRQALAPLRECGLIEGTPGRGTFVRSVPGLVRPGFRTAGVVVSLVAQPHVADLVRGIEGELRRRGYLMLMGDGGSTSGQQADRVDRLLDQGAAALIVYPIDYGPDPVLFQRLAGRGVPLVLVDRYLPGLAVDAVVPDNLGGAYEAVSHLVAAGHRRIAFVSTDNLATTSVAERWMGYRQALAAAGLPLEPDLVFDSLPVTRTWPADDELASQTPARIARFLERAAPTAVFALHDRLAVDVFRAAALLDLPVPGALSVMGFDDDPVSQAVSPQLSTVAQPREEMGRLAAELVVARLEGRRADVARTVLPARLVVRESTAPSAAVTADDRVRRPARG